MRIDISPILKNTGAKLHIELEEPVSFEADDIRLTKPVHVDADVINTSKSFLLTANVQTEVMLDCGRCLQEFKYPIHFVMEEQYCKSMREYKEITGEYELTEEDFVYLVGEDNTIDLYEVLRQNIIARLPITVTCKPDCRGFEQTKPSKETIDPRLAKLQELRDKL